MSERPTGRTNNSKRATRSFLIEGAADDNEALSKLLADAPAAVNGKPLSPTESEVEEIDESGIFTGTAVYVSPEYGNREAGSFTLSFDIAGTTQRITQSRSTVASYTRPGSWVRSFGGALNVSSDGSVEGTDIIVPTVSYEFTKTYPDDQFEDGTFIRVLIAAVGSVNDDTWQGLDAGEALLSRVSGRRRHDGKWDVTFGVAVSLNEEDLAVGEITGIDKEGWDYLWVYYAEEEKTTGGGQKYVGKVPVNAFVERIYRRTDYDLLEI